jgi:hypothetical protein
MAVKRSRQNTLSSWPNPAQSEFQHPIVTNRNPTTADQAEIGCLWINQSANTAWVLSSIVAGSASWQSSPSGAGTETALVVDPGDVEIVTGNLLVDAGNITATLGAITAGTTLTSVDIVATGTLQVGGASTLSDVTIGGNVAIVGDFDLSNTASTTIESTNNAVGAITLLANGGVLETILIQSAQGTSATSINIDSQAGGITLDAALGTADAINIISSGVGGGIDIDANTGGIAMNAANGIIAIESGTAATNIGTAGVQKAISIGNATGTTSVTLTTGTGAMTFNAGGAFDLNITGALTFDAPSLSFDATTASNFTVTGAGQDLTLDSVGGSVVVRGSEASATALTLSASDAAGGISVVAGTGGLDMAVTNGAVTLASGTGAINISADAAATTVNLATGAGVKTLTIGSTDTTSPTTLQCGTGAMTLTAGGILDMNVTGAVTIDGTSISLDGTLASNLTVTGAAADLTLSSVGGSVVVDGSEAAVDAVRIHASDVAGGIDIDAGTGGIDVATTSTVNILAGTFGTYQATDDVTLQSTTASAIIYAAEAVVDAIQITCSDPVGGLEINTNGLVAIAGERDTQASPTAASTLNVNVGQGKFTGFVTAAAGTQAFTITCNKVIADSTIFVTVANLNASGNGARMTLTAVEQAVGSFIVHTTNNGAGALGAGDHVYINFWVLG